MWIILNYYFQIPMRLFIFPLTVILAVIMGCDRKADTEPKTESKTSLTPGLVVPKSAEQAPVAATGEVQKKVQEAASQVKQASNAASSVTAQSSVKPAVAQPQVVKESTDQVLADTIDHARVVTKSQVSGSRQHAQKAEDEMSDMLKNK
jgi:hypothetical protein